MLLVLRGKKSKPEQAHGFQKVSMLREIFGDPVQMVRHPQMSPTGGKDGHADLVHPIGKKVFFFTGEM